MASGGSLMSWSVTNVAWTVTVHVSLVVKSLVGSTVKVVGPPLTEALCPPLVAQEIAYQPSVTLTGSLNVSETFDVTETPLAPFAGGGELTVGAWSAPQMFSGDSELRGLGASAVKSAELLFVSVQPPPRRSAAVVFESVGAGAPSKKFAPS